MAAPVLLYALSMLFSLSVVFPNIIGFLTNVRLWFLTFPSGLSETGRLGIAVAIFILAALAQFWQSKRRIIREMQADPKRVDPALLPGLETTHRIHQRMDFVLTRLFPVVAFCFVLWALFCVAWSNS